jgi:hypothetical protein
MPGLVLVILLLQRLGVIIDIFSVLIYFLYQKIMFASTISMTKDDSLPHFKKLYIENTLVYLDINAT